MTGIVIAPETGIEFRSAGAAPRPTILTWGLLGPGKGIEHVIRALSLLQDVRPRITYTVAGATHRRTLRLTGPEIRTLVGMTPSARHVTLEEMPEGTVEVTAAVDVTAYRPA